jgi:hypothetical protein
MITVAEEGNRRRGEMTSDEVQQCIHGTDFLTPFFHDCLVSRLCSALAVDIKSWFERKSNISIADGAERSDFQRLAKATDEADPPEVKNLPLSLIKSVELSHSSVPRQWIHLVHGKGSYGY